MALYARIESGQVAEYRDLESNALPPHKSHLWRPVEGAPPPHDTFRQTVSGPVETIEAARVLRVWTVQDTPPEVLAGLVKLEARRRILARYPDWKQINMTARSVELLAARPLNAAWSAAEQAEADALQAAWDWIKAIRAASDVIEQMSPLPADYAADFRWPA